MKTVIRLKNVKDAESVVVPLKEFVAERVKDGDPNDAWNICRL